MKYIILTIVLFCPHIFSQSVFQTQTPEWVIQQNYTAMKNKDWNAIAEYSHSEDCDKIKTAFVEVFKDSSNAKLLKEVFPSVSNVDSFVQISSRDIYRLYMKFALDNESDVVKTMQKSDYKVIGHVNEGDSLAHVVVRMDISYLGRSISTVGVLTLKREESKWKIISESDVKTNVNRFIEFMKAKSESND